MLCLFGLIGIGLVVWRLLFGINFQEKTLKDQEALRLTQECGGYVSNALLCADLVLSGGNTYLANATYGYVEKSLECLSRLRTYSNAQYKLVDPIFESDLKLITRTIQLSTTVSTGNSQGVPAPKDQQKLYLVATERLVDMFGDTEEKIELISQDNRKEQEVIWKQFFILTGVVTIGFGVIVFASWRMQTSTLAVPIKQLADKTRLAIDEDELGPKPEFTFQSPITEIDDLRSHFSLFVERIYENKQELEETVEKRTFELSNALDIAIKANDTKTTFLANMSHELRTPLNAIIGYSELCLEELEDIGDFSNVEEIATYIGHVRQSGLNLLYQINDVLDISKIESGNIDLAPQNLVLKQFLEDILPEAHILAERKQNRLIVNLPDEAISIRVDPGKLRQVLINIIGNACKFTENGEVIIEASFEPKPRQQWVNFNISDSGIGISDEDIEGIFSPYEQRSSSRKLREEGTGLGLAISQRLSRLLGGNISVKSKLGSGSTFTVSLPIVVDHLTS